MVEAVQSVNTNGINNIPQQTTTQKTSSDNKSVSNNKIIMGASALAGLTALTIGSILFHRSQKLTKEIENLASGMKKNIENFWEIDERYKKFFDPEIAKQHIDAALRIKNKKERLQTLKDIEYYKGSDRGLLIGLDQGHIKPEKLPENVRSAIEAKDHIQASKLYSQYLDNLFHKSETAGKTIQESVENIFGKGTEIKPHTYDTSKEYDVIATNNNTSGSGYQMAVVNRQNEIADHKNWEASKDLANGCYSIGVMGHMPQGVTKPIIQQGTYKGRKYTSITFGPSDSREPSYGFTLFSPKGQSDFTPAQKDMLKIDTQNISDEDIKLLYTLPLDGKKANYDGVLSLVQHLSEKYSV